jgi:hypothetical protein
MSKIRRGGNFTTFISKIRIGGTFTTFMSKIRCGQFAAVNAVVSGIFINFYD